MIHKISIIDHINQFVGFGLYDHSFLDILRRIDDNDPYLRGIVAELGFKRADVYYNQDKRIRGKTSFNFSKMYDLAMTGITSYSKRIGVKAVMPPKKNSLAQREYDKKLYKYRHLVENVFFTVEVVAQGGNMPSFVGAAN